MLPEPFRPEFEASIWYRIADLSGHSRAGASANDALPGEEGKDSAGSAGLIPVIEVVGPGVVEIDRPFHQPEAKDLCIEIIVTLCVAGDGGYMVDAGDRIFHCLSFSSIPNISFSNNPLPPP